MATPPRNQGIERFSNNWKPYNFKTSEEDAEREPATIEFSGRSIDRKISTTDYLVLKGTVRGKTIELEEPTDLPDGLEITVAIPLKPGDGVRLTAGSWADMTPEQKAELEDFLSQSRGRPIKLP